MNGVRIAQQNFHTVVKTMENYKQEEPQKYRNAFSLPLFFYIQNSVEESTQKILNGMNRENYIMPPKEEMLKILRALKEGAE